MINKDIVYKIRYLPLAVKGKTHKFTDRELAAYGGNEEWVNGYSVIPKLGGSGKTFTSKAIVNRMFRNIQAHRRYGSDFKCEIVTFNLNELSASDKTI